MDAEPRYKVVKESGSWFARIIDTHTGRVKAKYNVVKNSRKCQFGLCVDYCKRLNEESK